MKAAKRKCLGQLLVESLVISRWQLDQGLSAQQEQGGRIAETLIGLGHLSSEIFAHFLAKQPGIASIDLGGYEVEGEVAGLVPGEFAWEREVFPLDRLGNFLTVAMVCPLDRATIEDLEAMTGLRVNPVLCGRAQMEARLQTHYGERPEPAGQEAPGAQPIEELGHWFLEQWDNAPETKFEGAAFVEFPADLKPAEATGESAASGYLSWPAS